MDASRRAARESYRGAFDLAKKDMAAGALRQTVSEMDFPKTIEGTSASIRLKSAVQFLDNLLMQVTSNANKSSIAASKVARDAAVVLGKIIRPKKKRQSSEAKAKELVKIGRQLNRVRKRKKMSERPFQQSRIPRFSGMLWMTS